MSHAEKVRTRACALAENHSCFFLTPRRRKPAAQSLRKPPDFSSLETTTPPPALRLSSARRKSKTPRENLAPSWFGNWRLARSSLEKLLPANDLWSATPSWRLETQNGPRRGVALYRLVRLFLSVEVHGCGKSALASSSERGSISSSLKSPSQIVMPSLPDASTT